MSGNAVKGCYADYRGELAGVRACDFCADNVQCMNESSLVKAVAEKNRATKLDKGKPKLSLIHPSMMMMLLGKFPNNGIPGAMYHLSLAAHAKDEGQFIADLLQALTDIVTYLTSETDAIRLTTRAMEYGASKPEYGRNNWKKGMEWSRLIDAAQRHGLAILDGEDTDPESGNPHVAHMLASIHMLLGNHDMKIGTNDLY
jgi:hypothetical protein